MTAIAAWFAVMGLWPLVSGPHDALPLELELVDLVVHFAGCGLLLWRMTRGAAGAA